MTIDISNYKVIKECQGNNLNKIELVQDKKTEELFILK